MKRALLVCLILLVFTLPVSATPSTLIWIPSTDIQPADKIHFGIDNYSTMKSGAATGAFTTPDYGLTFGAKNFEFGVDYIAGQDKPYYFNAKFRLLGKEATDLNFVLGVYNLSSTSATNQEVKYGLFSITDSKGWRYSAGYGYGRKAALGNDNKMVIAGIDKQFNDKWWAGVDYQGGKSALGALNFGVAYSFAPNVSVLIGYDIYNNKDYKNTITTQLDINF